MELLTSIGPSELAKLQTMVSSYNKTLAGGKGISQVLDKNDFLKILITQLTHQDPTQPMEDREFVSQMATFSTLEQITNMNDDISRIFSLFRRSEALGLLGKTVELTQGQELISGVVEEVTGDEVPMVMVNGTYYDFGDVVGVRK
jgi:flagellar basal-body rod modification protein FlgD